eukprot:COSAG06_NODE_4609_length_4102_cov_63.784911_2_plen_98_part_00
MLALTLSPLATLYSVHTLAALAAVLSRMLLLQKLHEVVLARLKRELAQRAASAWDPERDDRAAGGRAGLRATWMKTTRTWWDQIHVGTGCPRSHRRR